MDTALVSHDADQIHNAKTLAQEFIGRRPGLQASPFRAAWCSPKSCCVRPRPQPNMPRPCLPRPWTPGRRTRRRSGMCGRGCRSCSAPTARASRSAWRRTPSRVSPSCPSSRLRRLRRRRPSHAQLLQPRPLCPPPPNLMEESTIHVVHPQVRLWQQPDVAVAVLHLDPALAAPSPADDRHRLAQLPPPRAGKQSNKVRKTRAPLSAHQAPGPSARRARRW